MFSFWEGLVLMSNVLDVKDWASFIHLMDKL